MHTQKIKITFCDKRTGKDLWADGEVKDFCDWTPEPQYVDSVNDIIPTIRYWFDIDDDVEIYVDKNDCMEDGNYYFISYFSGSSQRGRNMSDYQMERFKAGKCCGWNHTVFICLEKVFTLVRPITDFT